jgi:hypothetical protein
MKSITVSSLDFQNDRHHPQRRQAKRQTMDEYCALQVAFDRNEIQL